MGVIKMSKKILKGAGLGFRRELCTQMQNDDLCLHPRKSAECRVPICACTPPLQY